MKKILYIIGALTLVLCGYLLHGLVETMRNDGSLTSPFVSEKKDPDRPLLAYTLAELKNRTYQASPLSILEKTDETDELATYIFSYQTLGKKMTGQLNIPKTIVLTPEGKPKVIVLVRGYVPLEIYESGVGTKNAAAFFAERGYVTVSPDFFSYGGSDPEPKDSWQARFEKPIAVIELIKSVETFGVPTAIPEELSTDPTATINPQDYRPQTTEAVGIWAHSNGGQITLATLEILSQPIPATLWAPVTAPFPYSLLYFTDEDDDEGKSFRKTLGQFEELYDVFDFTLTQHLNWLTGPLQLHHGAADEAAPIIWSDEFSQKIELENERRSDLKTAQELLEQENATPTAEIVESINPELLEPIELEYYRYPNTDHNMRPSWDEAILKDLAFFEKWL